MKKVSKLVVLLTLLLTACIAPVTTDMAMEDGDTSAAEAVATRAQAEELPLKKRRHLLRTASVPAVAHHRRRACCVRS